MYSLCQGVLHSSKGPRDPSGLINERTDRPWEPETYTHAHLRTCLHLEIAAMKFEGSIAENNDIKFMAKL